MVACTRRDASASSHDRQTWAELPAATAYLGDPAVGVKLDHGEGKGDEWGDGPVEQVVEGGGGR
jgi:hypothetical protein